MTEEELAQMIDEEEKRLGVGSEDFIRRHREILEAIDNLTAAGKRR